MSWKEAVNEAVKKEMKPMCQWMYWLMFVATGLTYMMKTVEQAAAGSYEVILQNPEIATGSWLVNGMFF